VVVAVQLEDPVVRAERTTIIVGNIVSKTALVLNQTKPCVKTHYFHYS